MRVCYVPGSGKSLAGSERSLLNLIDQLSIRDDYEPYAILQYDCALLNELEKRGVPCQVVKSIDVFGNGGFVNDMKKHVINHASIPEARRYLRENHIDVVHMNNSYAPSTVPLAAVRESVPFVWHFREHATNFTFVNPKEMQRLFSKASSRIAISDNIKKYWEERTGLLYATVLNGVPVDDQPLVRGDLFADGKLRVLMLGRVKESKGQMDALRAVAELVHSGNERIHLTIVGMQDSSYDEQIRDFVREEGLSSFVALEPFASDVSGYLRQHNVGLLCSAAEAFGRTTVEYMTSGLLAIGTNSGGTPEIIHDAETGYLYEPGSWKQLAEVLQGVLDDFGSAQQCALRGQQDAIRRFSITRTASEVYELYVDAMRRLRKK